MEVHQPNPCKRWAHMSTIAQQQGGNADERAIWIYGGQAITSLGQALNTWTNTLLKMDLSSAFSTGNPPIETVVSASNSTSLPPQVALGSFWSSEDGASLFQFNGEYSDSPRATPRKNQLWEYDIAGNKWSTASMTGSGDVKGTAEGAFSVVPDVGSGNQSVLYQFGGHIDEYTTPNWDGNRIFLSSMTSLDMGDMAITNTSTYAASGDSGSRNSTNSNTPPLLRAASTLNYVPNLGTDNKGVLVSIGGGNQDQVLDNAILDVYDIGSGAFVKQATQGDIMDPRVSHCAVRGSAIVNGIEQHHIFVYGGQAANRTTQISEGSFTDLYILTLPSYTWTHVGDDLPGQPVARSGHTCNLVGDTMIVIGGYIDESIMCEQPGVYLFNTTSLSWVTDYEPNRSFETPILLQNLTGGSGTSNSTGGNGWQNPNENYTATVTLSPSSSLSLESSTSTSASATSASAAATSAEDAQATTTETATADLQKASSNQKLGAILGGVAGGLCLAFLVLVLVHHFAKRQRARERRRFEEKMFLRRNRESWGTEDEEEGDGFRAMAYAETRDARPLGGVLMRPLLSDEHDGPERGGTYLHRANDSQDSSANWSGGHASDEVEADTEGMQVTGYSHLAPRQELRITNPTNRSTSSLGYSATQRSYGSM